MKIHDLVSKASDKIMAARKKMAGKKMPKMPMMPMSKKAC